MSPLHLPKATTKSTHSFVGIYVPVGAVFPDVTPTPAALRNQLAKLSRTDALIECARLNLVLSNAQLRDESAKQAFCITRHFSNAERERIATFASEHRDTSGIVVFFRAQLLELIRWICVYCNDAPDDGLTFKNPDVRRAFATAALITSDIWGDGLYRDKFTIGENVDTVRRRALGAVRVAYDSVSCGMVPMLAIARGRRLFRDHFAQFQSDYESSLVDATRMSLDNFYRALTVIATTHVDVTPETFAQKKGGLFKLGDETELQGEIGDAVRNYVSYVSLSPDDLALSLARDTKGDRIRWGHYRAIRDCPILRTPDGRCIVLDSVFFAENALVGPLFVVHRGFMSAGLQNVEMPV